MQTGKLAVTVNHKYSKLKLIKSKESQEDELNIYWQYHLVWSN